MPGRYVLLVSDDKHLAEEVTYSFPQDLEVKIARDPTEAFAFMDAVRPEVAILEIRSGNSGGVALAEEMSQREGSRDVPILMLLERPQDEWLAKSAGASATRVQPLEASDLVAETLALVVPATG